MPISFSITDNKTSSQVIFFGVYIFCQQPDTWLATWMVVFREMIINMNLIKNYTLTLQRIENEIVNWPKSILWE